MGNFLDKNGLTRFKEKMLTEVDKRIASGGGGSSGDCPTKEEIIEGATRVTDVEVGSEVATVERLQTAVSAIESNLDAKLENSTIHIVEHWSNGKSWYKKYSNGWVEQGGQLTIATANNTGTRITFFVEFASTNYHRMVGAVEWLNNTTNYVPIVSIATNSPIDTLGFSVVRWYSQGASTGIQTSGEVCWEAKGYAK